MTEISAWPDGGGEMGALVRAHDWAETPAGAVEHWPQSLRVAVRLMLSTRHPMFIWWGPDLTQFYNDAYRETMGPEKHPAALGGSGRDWWPEAWPIIGPQIDHVMAGKGATWHDEQPVPILRFGKERIVWWTYGFSPIDDPSAPNGVGGVLVVCNDVTDQHEAAEKLRASEERWRNVFERMHEGFALCEMIHDAGGAAIDFRYLEVNDAWERLTGLAANATVGRRVREIIPDIEEYWIEAYARVVETGEPAHFEYEVSGLGRMMEVIAYRTGPGRFAALFLDVTERRRARRALAESEERYRTLFDSIDEGFGIIEMIFDDDMKPVDYRFIDVNRAWIRHIGIVDPIGKTAREVMPDLEGFWFETYGRVAISREPARFEHVAEPIGKWFDVFAFPTGEADQCRVALLFNDVSERKSAERALRESEERFRQFADNSSNTLWIMDADRLKLEYLSPSFERMWGLAREPVLDELALWEDSIHPEDRARVLQIASSLLAGTPTRTEYRIIRGDGETCWIDDTGFPIRDEQGRVRRIGGIAQDVTERHKAEAHQRFLLGELQHRVRNTLSVVRSIARRTADTSASVEEMAAHLQGRLDAFSRVQSAVTRHPGGGVDLTALIEDELLAYAAREGDDVRIQGPDICLTARAAETISLAIHELATNAVKHGALGIDGGQLEVIWSRERDGDAERLRLRWDESGAPMPAGAPRRRGFGLELLERTLPYDLRARTGIAFGADGLRFSLDMPLGPDVLAE